MSDSKSTIPYSLRFVSGNASTKYVPSPDETNKVPMFAEGEVRMSTAIECAVDSTTVYALDMSYGQDSQLTSLANHYILAHL